MSKPKAIKAPPTPAPVQTVVESNQGEVEDEAMKRTRRQSGYSSTILTGGLAPNTGKKTVLG
jgi:hypothetical protein